MEKGTEAAGLSGEAVPRTIGGFLVFTFREILKRRKWLLLPVWVLLAVVGVLLLLSGGSTLLPVIYIAF